VLFLNCCSKYQREKEFVLEVVNNTEDINSVFKKYKDLTKYFGAVEPVDTLLKKYGYDFDKKVSKISTDSMRIKHIIIRNFSHQKNRLKYYYTTNSHVNIAYFIENENGVFDKKHLKISAINDSIHFDLCFEFTEIDGHFVLENIYPR